MIKSGSPCNKYVSYICMIPGMSDHYAVSLEKHTTNKQFYKVEIAISETREFWEKFFEQDLYLTDIIEKFASSKEIKPHKDVLWLNQFIKYRGSEINYIFMLNA